jgi:ABC-type transport system involved in cytochrome bd biosynthesis fused ATPase/permease subunit
MVIKLANLAKSRLLKKVIINNKKNFWVLGSVNLFSSLNDLILIVIISAGISSVTSNSINLPFLEQKGIMLVGIISIAVSILLNWKINYMQSRVGYMMGGNLAELIIESFYRAGSDRSINIGTEVLNLALNESVRSSHSVLVPLLNFITKSLTSVILLICISFYSGYLVLLLAIYLFFVIALYKILTKRRISELGLSVTDLTKSRTGLVNIQVVNKREIQIFEAQQRVKEIFCDVNQSIANSQASLNKISGSSKNILEGFLLIPIFLSVGYGEFIGLDIVVIVAFLKIAPSMYQAFLNYLAFSSNLSSIARIVDFGLKMDGYHKKTSTQLPCKEDGVLFSTSGFSFQIGSREIYIPNFQISCKDKIVFTGKSGSGKSTFIDLLLGDFPSKKGSMCRKSRSKLSIATQNPGFIDGTVRENLNFFVPGFDMDLTQEYLNELFQEDGEFILNKDMGLLSGGEKLRVSIVRAVLREADLYIFDEINSSLDKYSSKIALNFIERELTNKAVIMILHKDIKYIHADKYINFGDDGRVCIEAG